MLSAVLQRLREMRSDPSWDRRLTLMDVCSSAYPDVRPWQVRQECTKLRKDSPNKKKESDEAEDLYYIYLSQILHPTDGHDTARHDSELVKVRGKQ
jgi:hypothetical protein